MKKSIKIILSLLVIFILAFVLFMVYSDGKNDTGSSSESSEKSSFSSSANIASSSNISSASSSSNENIKDNKDKNDSIKYSTDGVTASSPNTEKTPDKSEGEGVSNLEQDPPVGTKVDRPNGDWVATFEKNLKDKYGATPKYYVYYGDGYWEVWVNEYDVGENNPYVTVNQNTGDFHG
ncbi:hypothetical protein [Floricoccus penangensis]|uniref:hypothetical protein n=1 Tax=Floricoccus penangensis TaxID=1859475 RepID=UPI00203F7823|nr:hypothetical protein [Floricoccus penangensis]URZ86662.1 hypothetical protein KIW23_06070 [Floricoccus penangensis]